MTSKSDPRGHPGLKLFRRLKLFRVNMFRSWGTIGLSIFIKIEGGRGFSWATSHGNDPCRIIGRGHRTNALSQCVNGQAPASRSTPKPHVHTSRSITRQQWLVTSREETQRIGASVIAYRARPTSRGRRRSPQACAGTARGSVTRDPRGGRHVTAALSCDGPPNCRPARPVLCKCVPRAWAVGLPHNCACARVPSISGGRVLASPRPAGYNRSSREQTL